MLTRAMPMLYNMLVDGTAPSPCCQDRNNKFLKYFFDETGTKKQTAVLGVTNHLVRRSFFTFVYLILDGNIFLADGSNNVPDKIENASDKNDSCDHESEQSANDCIQRKYSNPSRNASTNRQNNQHIRKPERNTEHHAETEPIDLSVYNINILTEPSNQQNCRNG